MVMVAWISADSRSTASYSPGSRMGSMPACVDLFQRSEGIDQVTLVRETNWA